MKMKLPVFIILFITAGFSLPAQGLNLGDLTDRALNNAPGIQSGRIETQLSETGIRAAEARFWPTIAGQISGSWLANPPDGVTLTQGSLGSVPNPGSTFPTPVPDADLVIVPDPLNTYFQAKISLTQPVYTWGKLRDGLEAAQIQLGISLLEQNKTENQIIRDVRQGYAGYLFAREAADILDRALAVYREIEQDRRNSFDQGVINREELLSVQQQLVEIESQALEARHSIRTAGEGLGLLTGIQGLTNAQITGTLQPPEELNFDLDHLIAQARSNNSDLQILLQRLNQTQIAQEIQQRTNGLRPDIALSVEMDVSGQRFPGIPNWRDYWDAGLTVTLGSRFTLFDGGAQNAKIQESLLQSEQVQRGYDTLYNSLSFQISQVYERHFRSYRRYLNARANRELIIEQEKNARVSFDNDLITREQVLGAELLVITNELELLSAAFEAENALSELAYYLGKPLE